MPDLYTVDELVSATGGHLEGDVPVEISAVSIDSRDMPKGGLFAAIKGVAMDGHQFVQKALDAGAGLAMVSAEHAGDFPGAPLLVVPEVLQGLRDIAVFARARSEARIVAVTGSAGKTTTKDALASVLAALGSTHAAVKSFNNHWGVPLTLARMPVDAEFGVFEIGMNHAGEITPLVKLVRPHIVVITTIAAAHLENLGSLEGIAKAKAEIFSGLEPGGLAVLNADHGQLDVLLAAARDAGVSEVVTYGFSPVADVQISELSANEVQSRARVELAGETLALRLEAPGRHNMANAVAALIVAHRLGVRLDDALLALKAFGAPEGRGAVRRIGPEGGRELVLIDESYNANPASMAAALEVFAQKSAHDGRKVLVLGDMLELGPESEALHRGLAGAVRTARPDDVFLVGPAMRALGDELGEAAVSGHADSVAGIAPMVVSSLALGDVVMVKGSNGVGLARLVETIASAFAGGTDEG